MCKETDRNEEDRMDCEGDEANGVAAAEVREVQGEHIRLTPVC